MRPAIECNRAVRLLVVGALLVWMASAGGSLDARQDLVYSISAASAQQQTTQVGTAFAENMTVRVGLLTTGAAAPGITVTFTAPASGPSGTFATTGTNVATAVTGANGLATAPTFTANSVVGGPYTVQVSAVDATPNFFFFTNSTNPATLATLLSVGDGSNQAAQINTTFAIQMSVVVFNGANQLLPGVTVTFTAPGSGASGTFANGTATTTAVTGSTGLATASPFTANGTTGTYFVDATVDGSQTASGDPLTASFALRNTLNNPIGVPEVVSASAGNGQQAPVLTAFATNLQVVVLDGSLNHVQGATVVFEAPSTGPSGTFTGGGTSFTTTSGATGLATAPTFTANAIAGSYAVTVTATLTGISASGSIGLTNGRVVTTTTLAVTPPGTSVEGETVTLAATIAPAAGTLVPSAPVAFRSGGTVIPACSAVAPSGGTATCALSALAVGTYQFSADYAGDSVSQPSSSAPVDHEVTAAPPAPPGFSKSFAPATIVPGGESTLTFTIANTSSSAATALAFTDTLPSGMTVAAAPDVQNTCTGGTVTAVSGSGVISYTGGAVGAGASCTIGARVTSASPGSHANTSGELTSSAGSSGTASATLQVASVTTTFTLMTATGTGEATGAITGGGPACTITTAEALDVAAVAPAGPPNVALPHGLFRFVFSDCTPGSTVRVTLTLPSAPPAGTEYWKFGPRTGMPTPDWFTIPATVSGATVTFDVTDGGTGDSDLAADGVITDPGGPGTLAQPVPSLPPAVMVVLLLALMAAAAATLRRVNTPPGESTR